MPLPRSIHQMAEGVYVYTWEAKPAVGHWVIPSWPSIVDKKVTSLSTVIIIIIVDSLNYGNNNRRQDLRDRPMGYYPDLIVLYFLCAIFLYNSVISSSFWVITCSPVDKQVSEILESLKAQLSTTIIFQIPAVRKHFIFPYYRYLPRQQS